MREYHFSAELAQRYGLDEAIMLHNFAYWVQKNTLDRRNIHNGRAWTYNSQDALTEWFPFWTRRQIQRILKSLEDQGVVIKDQFNENRMNRTMWYSLADSVLEYYGIREPDCVESDSDADEPAKHETVRCIDANGAECGTERGHAQHETVQCNIGNKEKTSKEKTTNTDSAGVDQRSQFAAFWARYPLKQGKKRAWESWQKLKPDPALFARIMEGLENHIRSEQWARRHVIPHPATWLNGEHWADEFPTPGGSTALTEEGCEYV